MPLDKHVMVGLPDVAEHVFVQSHLQCVNVISSECSPNHHTRTELDRLGLFKSSSGDRCQQSGHIDCKHCPLVISGTVRDLNTSLGTLQHVTRRQTWVFLMLVVEHNNSSVTQPLLFDSNILYFREAIPSKLVG